jgi:hypothetical protein
MTESPLQRSPAVELLLASTPPRVQDAPVPEAASGPSTGPLAAVAAAARSLHPAFDLPNPARQTARAQAHQIRTYLQQVVTAIQTAGTAVPAILDRAAQDEVLHRELEREEIDVELVRGFLARATELLNSVSATPHQP